MYFDLNRIYVSQSASYSLSDDPIPLQFVIKTCKDVKVSRPNFGFGLSLKSLVSLLYTFSLFIQEANKSVYL